MTKLTRPERVQVFLAREEMEAIEDFRFDQRIPSRAAAVRELFRRALAANSVCALQCEPDQPRCGL